MRTSGPMVVRRAWTGRCGYDSLRALFKACTSLFAMVRCYRVSSVTAEVVVVSKREGRERVADMCADAGRSR